MVRRGNPDPVVVALLAARKEQGITLLELSKRLGHGDSARTRLSMWERGVTSPTLHSLRRWIDALGLGLIVVPAAEADREGQAR